MSVYDTSYATKEELLQALDSSIQESKNDDGTSTFSLQNDLADKYYAEIQNAKKQRQEKQEALRQKDALQAELEQFRALGSSPDKTNSATPQALLDEMRTLKENFATMEKQNAEYRERETRTKINAKLREIAENVGVSQAALKDVASIYGSKFRLTEDGKLREIGTEIDATEIMKKALEDRPYWNQKSKGGGASSNVGGVQNSRAKAYEAMSRGDFASAFYNAPIIE